MRRRSGRREYVYVRAGCDVRRIREEKSSELNNRSHVLMRAVWGVSVGTSMEAIRSKGW